MFVVVTWFGRPAPQTLTTRLASIAADLPSFAFGTGVRRRDPLGNATRGRFGSLLRPFNALPGWRKPLDCSGGEKHESVVFFSLSTSFAGLKVLTGVEHLGRTHRGRHQGKEASPLGRRLAPRLEKMLKLLNDNAAKRSLRGRGQFDRVGGRSGLEAVCQVAGRVG